MKKYIFLEHTALVAGRGCNSMNIRRAELEDKKQIIRLVKELYSKDSPKTVREWEMDYKYKIRLTLLAEINKNIVAYIANGIEGDNLYIGDLYVLPKYRRKGIATSLILETDNLKKLINKKQLRVDARNKDKIALKFYEKMGFKFLSKKGENSIKLIK